MNLSRKIYVFYLLYIFPISTFVLESSKNYLSTENIDYEKNHLRVRRSTTKAERMCKIYTKQACISKRSVFDQGPNSLHKIIGGFPAEPKQFPNAVEVGFPTYNPDTVAWLCGGSLISENFVMSAGHCAEPMKPTRIRFNEPERQTYKIIQIIVHPNYVKKIASNDYSLQNDIALLKFEGLQKFTDYIRPVCLNVLEDPPKKKIIVIGWGKTETNDRSDKLMAVELNLQHDSTCRAVFEQITPYNNKSCLCAGHLPGGKDSCDGDSGGPLQYLNDESECSKVPMYVQIGIVSYGKKKCGSPNCPAVYTRISSYISWIEGHVWK